MPSPRHQVSRLRSAVRPAALTLFLAASALPGCGGTYADGGALYEGPAGATAGARSAGALRDDGSWLPGTAKLFIDGPEIFPAMEAMIASATRSVQVNYYILSGAEGDKLARLLADRVRAGVDVQVELDPHMGTTPMISESGKRERDFLIQAGARVVAYPDSRRQAEVKGKAVDHDKVVVVDGRIAMTGGMNVADVFAANHDYMAQVTGPAAEQLSANLTEDMGHGVPFGAEPVTPDGPDGNGTYQPVTFGPGDGTIRPGFAMPAGGTVTGPATDPAGPDDCRMRVCTTGFGRTYNKQAVLDAIQGAQQSIHVEMFQLCDSDVLDALIAAHARGVDVRVLADPGNIDPFVPVIHWAPKGFPNLPGVSVLAHDGVAVQWYHLARGQAEMHSKTAVIDGHLLFVGSTNWTGGGFGRNNETSVEIDGGAGPAKWEAMFAQDWATRGDVVKPVSDSLYQKFKAWIIGKFGP